VTGSSLIMSALPWAEKIRPGRDRVLQRRALQGRIPEVVRTRSIKSGTAEVIARGLLENPAAFRLLTEKPLIAQLGFVDEDRWTHTVSVARFGMFRALPSFLASACLEFWLRQR
jgi:hypothetical protein